MQELCKFARDELDAYRLDTFVEAYTHLSEDVNNWYIRLNRDRMRGAHGPEQAQMALVTLFEVLLRTTVILAPFTPFLSEHIYQNLSRGLPDDHHMKRCSVHLVPYPDDAAAAQDLLRSFERVKTVIGLGRLCREQRKAWVMGLGFEGGFRVRDWKDSYGSLMVKWQVQYLRSSYPMRNTVEMAGKGMIDKRRRMVRLRGFNRCLL